MLCDDAISDIVDFDPNRYGSKFYDKTIIKKNILRFCRYIQFLLHDFDYKGYDKKPKKIRSNTSTIESNDTMGPYTWKSNSLVVLMGKKLCG